MQSALLHGPLSHDLPVFFRRRRQTVAHCLVNPKIVSISVTLGTYSDTPNSASQKIKAASWTPHPKYDGTLKTSDIGVVKLSQKVVIAPIKLSFTSGFPKQGRNVTVIGDDLQ
jgi:secreted trypsin-like serine protease